METENANVPTETATEQQPEAPLASPMTSAQIKEHEAALKLAKIQAITDLRAKRQAAIDGAKTAAEDAKAQVKNIDAELRELGAKRPFKERKKRTPKLPTAEPAAPKSGKKKGA